MPYTIVKPMAMSHIEPRNSPLASCCGSAPHGLCRWGIGDGLAGQGPAGRACARCSAGGDAAGPRGRLRTAARPVVRWLGQLPVTPVFTAVQAPFLTW